MQKLTPALFKREAIAGITTFFTMAYIVVLNPMILAQPATGMNFAAVLTATVLLSFLMTLFMGLYAKVPYAVAPGMGINAFFAYTLIMGKGIPWPTALGIVFWAGVFFVLISVTPLRRLIAQSIPHHLRIASAAGIGVFLTFIGLKNANLIVASPATFVTLGPLKSEPLLCCLGILIIVFFLLRKSPLAFLIGIFAITALAWALKLVPSPESWVSTPDFSSTIFKLDIWGALKFSLAPSIFALCFTDLFDSISTFIGVSEAAGLTDAKGEPKGLQQGLLVDAFATLGAGLLGTSSGTAYIESSAGIEAGGRTGLTSVVTAFCFLPCLFLAPLAQAIPPYATAPVLILVGTFMFRPLGQLSFQKLEEALPAFLTMVMIPLSFSITQGILWGIVSHVLLFQLAGRRKELPWMIYPIAATCIAFMAIEHGG